MQKIQIAALVLLCTSFSASGLVAGTTQTTREFRPLEAKKVVFAPAAKVQVSSATSMLLEAWNHFDREEWEQAIDKFLTVMEEDAKNPSAAEGLAMSVYRSADYQAAYRLCVEFADFMPEISDKIAAAVLSDVRFLISQEKREAARQLLEHFPKSDLAFSHAHALIDGADTLAQNVGSDEMLPAGRLAKN